MSEFKGMRCDGCGKCVVDRHAEVGWLHFDAPTGYVTVTRSTGRGENNVPRHDYRHDVSDFCTVECLGQAIEREAAKRAAAK